MSRDRLNRRDFLGRTAGSLVGAGLGVGLAGCGRGSRSAGEGGPAATAVAQAADAAPAPGAGKSRVVLVKDARAATDAGVNDSAIREMLDKGVTALTGESDAKAAWASLFKPDDVVGVKVNCLFGMGVSTHPEVTMAAVEGIKSVGVPAEKIIIYDREDGHLRSVGYDVNRGAGLRCQGTAWTNQSYEAGVFKGRLSTILADEITALANVPFLKHHGVSGVSISMKNHYGSIDNPGACHDNSCNPAIADVCTLAPIKDKTRVVICDALVPQCEGGPGRNAAHAWNYGGLLLSKDMVALDYHGWQIIEARRKETNLGSLAGQVGHIASAAQRGLGTNDPNQIELVEI